MDRQNNRSEEGKGGNRGYLFILMTALAFSSMEIVGKMTSAQLNPFQLTFLRFIAGGVLLLPFALREIRKKKLALGLKDWGFICLSGFLNVVVSMSFFQLAVTQGKASMVAVIFSTNFVFTIPFARWILKEKTGKKMLLVLPLSLLGLILLFDPFSSSSDLSGFVPAVLAAVTFSFYTVFNRTRVAKYGGVVLTSLSFISGSLFLLVGLLAFGLPVISGIGTGNAFQLLYLGLFVTGIGYLCYFEAIKQTGAINASLVFMIKPALAPILAILILGETISGIPAVGMLLIALGSGLAILPEKQLARAARFFRKSA